MEFQKNQIAAFQQQVWDYYHQNNRPMPWRVDTSDYSVFVSEIMLQQTQVSRVIEKFNEFVRVFADFRQLAEASQSDVLRLWSGLGYNRRALFLHTAAKKIMAEFGGTLPNNQEQLVSLPGVGPNTAGAIRAYVFNEPVVFIETNIRAVYIAHFFADQQAKVTDVQLQPLIHRTLDTQNPREWYWALMDYGVHVKKTQKNPARKSKLHVRQSKFEGSRRQLRGQILRMLAQGNVSQKTMLRQINDDRTGAILQDLISEKMIFYDESNLTYSLDA